VTVGSRSLNYSDCNRVGGRERRHRGRLGMAIEEEIRYSCGEREGETYEAVPVKGFGSEGRECTRSSACGSLCASDVRRNDKRKRYQENRHGYRKREKYR